MEITDKDIAIFSLVLTAIAKQKCNAFIAGDARALQYELAAIDDPKFERYLSDGNMQSAVERGTKALLFG